MSWTPQQEKVQLPCGGKELIAPGILQNPVPVEALYDRKAAHKVTLRNLLQRQGYRDLDEVRAEALRTAVVDVLEARGLDVDDETRTTLDGCRHLKTLQLWLTRAATSQTTRQVFSV